MIIDKIGYVARSSNKRNWYIIKNGNNSGRITIGEIYFPVHLIGRRCRLKLEMIKDGDKDE